MSSKLILASGSPRRKEILESLGVDFEIITADVDEHKGDGFDGASLALYNGLIKAEAVSKEHPQRWVLGADTVVELDGKIYGKPKDLEEAARMLSELSGKSHNVYTGVVLLNGSKGAKIEHCEHSKVHFEDLSKEAIDDFIAGTNPLDKAGGYGIQYCEREHCVVESYEGSYTNIVGLPKEYVQSVLKELNLLKS